MNPLVQLLAPLDLSCMGVTSSELRARKEKQVTQVEVI